MGAMINDKTAKDVMLALRYCTSDDGAFCDMCAYSDCGNRCSKILLLDASEMIKNYLVIGKSVEVDIND